MYTDDMFLAKLLEEPADDTTRLVYADWLDEQGDSLSAAKAEFLRVTVQLAAKTGHKGWRKEQEKRLQQMAATLDTDWLAVVSRLAIENCLRKRQEEERRFRGVLKFDFLCERRWEDLQSLGEGTERFCDACRQNVHFCATITEARQHAQKGHCIAVDLGVIRRERDSNRNSCFSVGRARSRFDRKRSGWNPTRYRPNENSENGRKASILFRQPRGDRGRFAARRDSSGAPQDTDNLETAREAGWLRPFAITPTSMYRVPSSRGCAARHRCPHGPGSRPLPSAGPRSTRLRHLRGPGTVDVRSGFSCLAPSRHIPCGDCLVFGHQVQHWRIDRDARSLARGHFPR